MIIISNIDYYTYILYKKIGKIIINYQLSHLSLFYFLLGIHCRVVTPTRIMVHRNILCTI